MGHQDQRSCSGLASQPILKRGGLRAAAVSALKERVEQRQRPHRTESEKLGRFEAAAWPGAFAGSNPIPNCSAVLPVDVARRRVDEIALRHDFGEDYALLLAVLTAPGVDVVTVGETLARLTDGDQIAFRYCDEYGEPTDAANPNGSLRNIAGVYNETKTILGLMPHPERLADPRLGGSDGALMFQGLVEALS